MKTFELATAAWLLWLGAAYLAGKIDAIARMGEALGSVF